MFLPSSKLLRQSEFFFFNFILNFIYSRKRATSYGLARVNATIDFIGNLLKAFSHLRIGPTINRIIGLEKRYFKWGRIDRPNFKCPKLVFFDLLVVQLIKCPKVKWPKIKKNKVGKCYLWHYGHLFRSVDFRSVDRSVYWPCPFYIVLYFCFEKMFLITFPKLLKLKAIFDFTFKDLDEVVFYLEFWKIIFWYLLFNCWRFVFLGN